MVYPVVSPARLYHEERQGTPAEWTKLAKLVGLGQRLVWITSPRKEHQDEPGIPRSLAVSRRFVCMKLVADNFSWTASILRCYHDFLGRSDLRFEQQNEKERERRNRIK